MCSTDFFLGLLALLFPPLPVWVKCGICSADSVINILLCVLGYIPGVLHAWYIIAKFPEPDYSEYERVSESERGHGGGRVTYVVVQQDSEGGRRSHDSRPAAGGARGQPKPAGNMSYGTNGRNNQHPSGPASSQPQPHPQGHNVDATAAGPSDGAPPPSYAQVVAGDNKIQDQS